MKRPGAPWGRAAAAGAGKVEGTNRAGRLHDASISAATKEETEGRSARTAKRAEEEAGPQDDFRERTEDDFRLKHYTEPEGAGFSAFPQTQMWNQPSSSSETMIIFRCMFLYYDCWLRIVGEFVK